MKKLPTSLRTGAVLAAAALLLSACADSTAEGEAAVDTENLSPEAQAAQAVVDQVSVPVEEFTAPGPTFDAGSLEGGTVYYVPATLQVPLFTNVKNALADALGNAGYDVQVCDGKANPADITSCLNQAVNADADAVVSGSIPEELAPSGFKAVQEAGIPLLYSQVAPAGPGEPTKVGYLTENNVEMQAWTANWVIAHSDAQAEVLVVKVTDTPATKLWTDVGALATYAEACPDCKVTVVETNTGQLDKLPSLISSALTKNAGITYVHAAFDVLVQPVMQGVQSMGRNDVLVSSHDGTLPAMQSLEGGQLASEVGWNQEALGWYAADQVLRMLAGEPTVQAPTFPYRRLFSQDSVAGLDLTPEGEKSGEWYGGTDYKDGFLELWSLDG